MHVVFCIVLFLDKKKVKVVLLEAQVNGQMINVFYVRFRSYKVYFFVPNLGKGHRGINTSSAVKNSREEPKWTMFACLHEFLICNSFKNLLVKQNC